MNSLLEDLIGFARENIEKAGISFTESNQRDRQLIDSYKNRQQVDPAQRQAMTEEYINQANPMSAVGGMIKPSTWAKYTPHAKASMTEMANRFPEKFKEVLAHPDDLMYSVGHLDLPENVGGQFQRPRPNEFFQELTEPSTIKLAPGYEKGPERVLEHEIQHFLGRDRVTKTAPDDAMTIGRLLQSQLNPHQRGSLDKVIHESTEMPTLTASMAPQDVRGRALELAKAKKDPWSVGDFSLQKAMDDRPLRKDMSGDERIVKSWIAMDEGLAHLAQAAARDDATPEIKKLATQLGVNFSETPQNVMEEFINRTVAGGGDTWSKIRKLFGSKPRDATFDKFRGPASNPNTVMQQMKEEAESRAKRYTGSTDPVPVDHVVESIMDVISNRLVKVPKNRMQPLTDKGLTWPGGVSGMREGLGDRMPFNAIDPKGRMKMEDFRGLLQHLDKYGLLKDPVGNPPGPLSEHINKSYKSMGAYEWKPEVLKRLRRFIEETKE